MIRAGTLDKRVEVQLPVETKDSFGAVVSGWQTQSKRWAAIEPMDGSEAKEAEQMAGRVPVQIRLRYFAGIGPRYRIKFGTRVFNVISATNPLEKGEETVIQAVEVV